MSSTRLPHVMILAFAKEESCLGLIAAHYAEDPVSIMTETIQDIASFVFYYFHLTLSHVIYDYRECFTLGRCGSC